MRVIARYGRYAVQVRPQITEAYATGHTRIIQSQLIAHFHEGGLMPDERSIAKANWTFNGFYQEQDEVTPVEPDYRIGVFDSHVSQGQQGWNDEERRSVEDELARLAALYPTTLIVIAQEQSLPPWPNYDAFTGSLNDLCTKIIEDGYPLEGVLAYEEENQDRPEVVQALKQLIDDDVTAPLPMQAEEVIG